MSALCKALGISRSSYYYKPKELSEEEIKTEKKIIQIFYESHKTYGTRRIKSTLEEDNIYISRQKISKIMKKHKLVSKYTKPKYKNYSKIKNENKTSNKVAREFSNRQPLEAVVTDLKYVRVKGKWAYICAITDLFNREIIGYGCSFLKDARLVLNSIQTIKYPLDEIKIFHTDRGKEFDNKNIDRLLNKHNIGRSLSRPGNPYDNAVAESIYKSIEIEFIKGNKFKDLKELNEKLTKYIDWWNTKRKHSSLNNKTPLEYRLEKVKA